MVSLSHYTILYICSYILHPRAGICMYNSGVALRNCRERQIVQNANFNVNVSYLSYKYFYINSHTPLGLYIYELTSSSKGMEMVAVLQLGEKSAKPESILFKRHFSIRKHETSGYFYGAAVNHLSQNRIFLTLNRCFLCLNLTSISSMSISTASSQNKTELKEMKTCNISVVCQPFWEIML